MSDEQTQPEVTPPTDQEQMANFVSESTEDAAPAAEKPAEKPAEAAGKTDEEIAAEPAEPPKRTVQDRINELTRERRDAERRAQELEARLAKLEQGAKPAEAAPVADAEPDPADATKYPYGELDKNYLRDFAQYTARQEHKRLVAADAEARKQQEAKKQQDEVQGKVRAMVSRGDAKYDDFQDAINSAAAAGAQLTPELALLLAESDVGEDVVYHLAKNPDEAKALAAKPPLSMAAAFGKLEARFAKPAEKPKAKATAAPPPPSHQARGANGRFAVSGDSDDFASVEAAYWESQRAGARG